MLRRVVSVALLGALCVLFFIAVLSSSGGVADTASAQDNQQVTLIVADFTYNRLYAIDPETGAYGALVDNLPTAPGALASFQGRATYW